MYGYEPPITDASKANEQYTKNVQLQTTEIFGKTFSILVFQADNTAQLLIFMKNVFNNHFVISVLFSQNL
jgi:hypothetical protein